MKIQLRLIQFLKIKNKIKNLFLFKFRASAQWFYFLHEIHFGGVVLLKVIFLYNRRSRVH